MSAPNEYSGPLVLALIGAGQAGRSIAAAAVRAGHRVVLEDVLPSKLRAALDEIVIAGMPGTLEVATTVEDAVREADLAIDFVPDELESKLEILSMIDRMAPPRTILCVPTQVLSVNDLASCSYRADRFVGVELQGTSVTVVAGRQTSPETIASTEAFWRSVGFDVVVRGDLVALP